MALSSPGTEITIVDESQYLPAAPNSIPLIVIATAQNKINASGTGVAPGTTAANANKLYQVTSQRDLVTYFGNPFFYKTTGGTPIQGYELNEYGLLAAYSVLGSTNLIYAIRANIDLAALVGRTGRPSSQPTNGSYWLNTSSSTWGIFEFNQTTGSFTNKSPIVITDTANISGGAPLGSIGSIGSYAVNLTTDYGAPDSWNTYWYKAGASIPTSSSLYNQWVAVGSDQWRDSWPIVQATVNNPVTTSTGNVVIARNAAIAVVEGVVNDGNTAGTTGTTLTVTNVTSGGNVLTTGTVITGTGITAGTYVVSQSALAPGDVAGGRGTYTVSQSQAVGSLAFTSAVNGASISGTTLTVSGTNQFGNLTVGSYISGSASVNAGSFVATQGYQVSVLGTTDFYTIGATTGTDNGNITANITGVTMTVSASVNSGVLATGRYISDGGTNITAGTYIFEQMYDWIAASSTNSGTLGSTSLTVTVAPGSISSIAVGQVVVGPGIPSGTTVTNYSAPTVTLSAALTAGVTNQNIDFYSATVAPVTATYASGGNEGQNSIVLSSVTGITVGQMITGTGLLGGTVVLSVTSATKTVTVGKWNGATVAASNFQTQASGTYRFSGTTGLGTPPQAGVTISGGKGIYKVNNNYVSTPASSITVQPTPDTPFTATGVGSGTGSAYRRVTSGTYITALGTGTGGAGTYTINKTQTVTALTITGYESTISCQYGYLASINSGSNITTVINSLNSLLVTGLTVSNVNNRVYMYFAVPDISIANYTSGLYIAGDSGVLADIGITSGLYYTPETQYATNAGQPLWRSTDAQPRPTGSVWIKTNAFNNGMNLAVSQYNTAIGSFVSKTVSISTSDWAVNATLDSTGGKAIPQNSVYAQVDFDPSNNSPVQLFYRSAVGPSVFSGTVQNPVFQTSSQLFVRVSQPGSSNLLPSTNNGTVYNNTDPTTGIISYVVTLSGTTANDFITAWNAADISYTTAGINSVTGVIELTHTEGGVILLDDSPSIYGNPVRTSPLVSAGFSVYDPSTASGTIGGKYGPYKKVNVTASAGLPASGGSGVGLQLSLITYGYYPNIRVYTGAGGNGYAVDDVVTLTSGGVTYTLKVLAVSSGVVTSVTRISGDSIPQYELQLSNWEVFSYVSDDTTPVASPTNGTLWFYSVINQVDIMVNVGGTWKGYLNVAYDSNGLAYTGANTGNNSTGPIIGATQPSTQSDGTPLVYGDLWISTADLDNYPVIYRWKNVNGVDQWVLLDNTDQTTENGVLFADARWGTSGNVDPVNDPIPTIVSLLTSDYLDLDAPQGAAYPQGTLLFNTRRSGYNVKSFASNYFNATSFPDTVLPTQTSAWVTASGNQTNGAPYMGRKAQRAMVVQALKVTVDTSTELREEQTGFNLMATPNYPELQPNMIALNNDRNQTAYIIGDTPLRLADDANAITAWATNAAGATTTGEDGLVTRDTYMGIYYPSGITTDLTGSQVVVPPSHMMLRTMMYNDQVAYPWFAPAGQRRGVVDNATNIGYIDAATGEFVTTKNRIGLRDVQYNNFINPIAFFQNIGLLNFGNKNSLNAQSALDRTNVARLICYIRDRLQVAVRPFLFEPNDSITRSQVRAVVQTLMADIQTKRGLYDYLVVCDDSNNTPARIDRSELWIDIAIEPVKAVEFIYIPVRILNTGEIAGIGQNG